MKKFKIFRQTLFIVIGLLIIKTFVHNLGWDVLEPTPLHTGILAGSVFVLGFILSSTHADYKESEKMPVALTTTIESMHQDGLIFKQQYKKFPYEKFREHLHEIIVLFREDIREHSNKTIEKVRELSGFFIELEKLGVPANYIVKLKQERNTILSLTLRMHYLLRIQPLPSAFILVQALAALIILMLIFTTVGGLLESFMVVGFFSFIYIYMLQLIRVMDEPFGAEGNTQDDISLFLLKEEQQRLTKKAINK